MSVQQPPKTPNALSLLNLLMETPKLTGAWYNRKEVKLDGYRFESCRFDGCKLLVTSANFELIECFIDHETSISYGHDLIKVIQLFNLRSAWPNQAQPPFIPVYHSNGTITIKGLA